MGATAGQNKQHQQFCMVAQPTQSRLHAASLPASLLPAPQSITTTNTLLSSPIKQFEEEGGAGAVARDCHKGGAVAVVQPAAYGVDKLLLARPHLLRDGEGVKFGRWLS